MLHLILESSVLRKDPRRQSAAFRTLIALMRENAVKLYIPDFVSKEFLSQNWAPLDEVFNQILSAVSKLSRGTTSAAMKRKLERLTKQVPGLRNEYKDDLRVSFLKWLEEMNGEIREFKNERTSDLIESYFEGTAAFSQRKRREDFPDSFIWYTIDEIAKEVDTLLFVCSDNNLRSAAERLGNVETYESLEALLQSPKLIDLSQEQFFNVHSIAIIEALKDHQDQMRSVVNQEVQRFLLQKNVLVTTPDREVVDGEIVAFDLGEIDLYFDEAVYFGSNLFQLPFLCKVMTEIDFIIYKADFYGQSDEEQQEYNVWDADWNDRNMHVSRECPCTVSGRLVVTLDNSLKSKPFDQKQIVNHFEVSLDSIDEFRAEVGELSISDSPSHKR